MLRQNRREFICPSGSPGTSPTCGPPITRTFKIIDRDPESFYYDEELKKELAAVELYDNAADPDKNVNVAVRPENVALLVRLAEKLKSGWRTARPA